MQLFQTGFSKQFYIICSFQKKRYPVIFTKLPYRKKAGLFETAHTRNMERTDIIVDYNGEQFVVELKLWRGNAYNVSFNFNKRKQTGVKEIMFGEKILVEAIV